MSEEKLVFKVNGMMRSHSNVICDEVEINGMFRVHGDLMTKSLDGNGYIKVSGKAKIDTVKMSGYLKVKDGIVIKDMNLTGNLIAKDVNAEILKINGKLKIAENINCEKCEFIINSNSCVECIEGSRVVVSHHKVIKHVLRVNTISADEIDLENVICDTISGDKVIIRKGCIVNNVIYRTSLEIEPNAIVRNQEKTN